MGFLQFLQGAERQLNTFDNNATYKNSQGNGQQTSTLSQIKNTGVGIAKGVAAPFAFFAKTDVINPFKEVAAEVTGNKVAEKNAIKSQFSGAKNAGQAIRQVAGNAAQVGLTFLAPGVENVAEQGLTNIGVKGIANKVLSGAVGGAAAGAPFNVAGEIASNQPLIAKNIVNSAVSGAEGGALIGGIVGGIHAGAKSIKPVFADEGIPGKIPVSLLEKLSKSDNVGEVKSILHQGLPEDIADQIAPAIAKTNDPNIIQSIVDKAQPTLPNVGTSIPRVEQPVIPPAPEPELLAHLNNPAENVNPSVSPIDLRTATIPGSGESVLGNAAVKGAAESSISTPSQQFLSHLKEATATRATQEAGYTVERGAKLAASESAGSDLPGLAGHRAEQAALKGSLTKEGYTGLSDKLAPAERDSLFTQMRQQVKDDPNINGYAKLNTAEAVRKVIYGDSGVPTNSELRLIKNAFGSDVADGVKQDINLTFTQKAKALAVDILGAPKALLASYDISGGFRQGGVLGSRFPKEMADAMKAQLKYFGSKDTFENAMNEIGSRPNAELYKKADLSLTGLSEANEEAYVSGIAEKIPGIGRGVAASDRAYTGLLTKLRADSFDHIMSDLKDSGINPEDLNQKQLSSIGRFLNTASGRGNLGALEKHAQSLGQALFSPRLWKSRLDMLNPLYYKNLDPIARKYALQSAGSFASIAATVLGLATLAGAKVETDARSSDFLKIKTGNTRFDILGGFQQNLVLADREIFGQKKSSLTGGITKLGDKYGGATRFSVLSDFIQNKENPVISTGSRLLKGKDASGNPINPVTEVAKLGIPLGFQDTYQAVQDSGPGVGAAKSIPGFLGVGNQTYSASLNAKSNKIIQKLKDSGAPQEKIQAYSEYFKTVSVAKGTQTNVSDAINQALQKNDMKKARQLAKDYNDRYASSFQEWRQKYGKYADATLTKDYKSNKINLTSASIKTRLKTIKANEG